ncbi:MAG: hypothetical protein MPF33_05590 [Candidatus Aramenus sp.]|jgi:hypothetical protein|nr:hypothetical protein [Candidatus Aramenus sp.]
MEAHKTDCGELRDLLSHPLPRRIIVSQDSPGKVKEALASVGILSAWKVDDGELAKGLAEAASALRGVASMTLKELCQEGLDTHGREIREAYEALDRVKGVGPAIASVLLYLLNPSLFLPWDSQVAELYLGKSKNLTAEDYLEFLKASCKALREVEECLGGASESPGSLLQLLDAYNKLRALKARRQREGLVPLTEWT